MDNLTFTTPFVVNERRSVRSREDVARNFLVYLSQPVRLITRNRLDFIEREEKRIFTRCV